MKKKKFTGIAALIPLVLCDLAAVPAYAEEIDYREVDTGTEKEASVKCQVIYKSTYDFSEEIPKYPELEISSSGYEGVYDGNSHGIAVECKVDGASILYSTDGRNYTDKKPVYKDAGTYVTYYRVEKDGYTTVTGTETVKIKEAVIDFTSNDYSCIYDGKMHGIDLSAKTDGCKILYSVDGINYTSKKPEYKEPGTYVVYYKIMKDNYATVTGSSTVTIRANDSLANSGVQNSNNQNDNRNQNSIEQNNNGLDGNASSDISKVQTGDRSNILLYAAMLLASVFGLAKSKKREEKGKL